MNIKQFFLGRAIVLSVILVLGFIVGGFYAINNYIYNEKQGDGKIVEPYRATLSGEYVCLPHKDQSGPQTTECAFGMRTDTGEFYGVDFGLMSQTPPQVNTGEYFTANGVVTPIERLSSDHMSIYDIEGIFSVTDSFEKNIKLAYRCGDGSEFYVRFDKSMNSAEIIGATDSENFVDTTLTKVVTDSGVLYKGGNISFFGYGESVTFTVGSSTTSCKEIRREEDAPFNFGD